MDGFVIVVKTLPKKGQLSPLSCLTATHPNTSMEAITEGVNKMNIPDSTKNRIHVSNSKKPIFFFVNLAKSYMKQYNEVELSALGSAIASVVSIAEILKHNGLAVEKKIRTSTVVLGNPRGRAVQKARIEIVLEKTANFDELMVAAAAAENGDNEEHVSAAAEKGKKGDNEEHVAAAAEKGKKGDNEEQAAAAAEKGKKGDNEEQAAAAAEKGKNGDNEEQATAAAEKGKKGDNEEHAAAAAEKGKNGDNEEHAAA